MSSAEGWPFASLRASSTALRCEVRVYPDLRNFSRMSCSSALAILCGVLLVTIPILESIIRHPLCGGVPLAQDVAFYRRFGEPLAPVAQRLRAAPKTAAGLR